VRDVPYDTPSGAAGAVCATASSGWRFWLADTPTGQRSLHDLRAEYQAVEGADQASDSAEG
jgi:hypothetical protein